MKTSTETLDLWQQERNKLIAKGIAEDAYRAAYTAFLDGYFLGYADCMNERKAPRVYTCCLCGRMMNYRGHDAWPLARHPQSATSDDRCCDECNKSLVIPKRTTWIDENK